MSSHVITCHHVDCCDINASTEAAFMLLNLMSTSNLAALPGHGSLRSTWRGTGKIWLSFCVVMSILQESQKKWNSCCKHLQTIELLMFT